MGGGVATKAPGRGGDIEPPCAAPPFDDRLTLTAVEEVQLGDSAGEGRATGRAVGPQTEEASSVAMPYMGRSRMETTI